MPIKKSIEDLPRSSDGAAGTPPSSNPFIGEAVAEQLLNYDDPDHPRDLGLAIPEAGPYRGSYASKRCNRQLWYALTQTPESNPNDEASLWQFVLGHIVHDKVQSFANELFDGAEVEVNIDLNSIGIPGSAHADMVVEYKGKKILVELKSINGFGF